MALRILASPPDPGLLGLPWHLPLAEWPEEHLVPLPRGLSRHVVRIVRVGEVIYAVKETVEEIAFREYGLLRDLRRLDLPSVVPQAVVTGRRTKKSAKGVPLPSALVTRHLAYSLPYRSLFAHGRSADSLPPLIDAIAVLLVRLHLDGFYWGDVSLSNVLFRRDAGAFAAYLVDAETGELRGELSPRLREYDVTVGCENIFAELLDLQAAGALTIEIEPEEIVEDLRARYEALWAELTGEERFGAQEMWRVNERIERLNDLGFDVEELDMITDYDGDEIVIRPRVVEQGHHRRELQSLTGLGVEDNQARRLLNDLAAYTASRGLGREHRQVVAGRWMHEVFEPILALVPPEARGKLEPAEIFHEILVHRWYLSEQAGAEVDIFETAEDYIAHVLAAKPDEALTPPVPGLADLD